MTKRLWRAGLGLALGAALAGLGYRALRAHAQLVSLKVQNVEVREVVRKIERQTWRRILVHREVQGRVTLDVEDMPLAEVMALVGRQVQGRSLALYPLYSSRGSLARFKQAACGELEPTRSGWSNLVQVVHPAAPPLPSQRGVPLDEPITLQLTNQHLRVAALAVSRFANLQVVPEDGCSGFLSLRLQEVPAGRAVRALAGQARRHTAGWWSLLPGFGPGPQAGGPPPSGFAPRPGPPGGRAPPPPPGLGPVPTGSPSVPPPPSLALQQQMEQDYQALIAVLPSRQAERLAAERQFQSALQQMSPAQREQALPQPFESDSSSLLESRRQGLRQSSVAERVDRDRQEAGQ